MYAKHQFTFNFGQTYDYEMSRDLAIDCLIFANLVSKVLRQLKKNVTKRQVAICSGCTSVVDIVQDPPPGRTRINAFDK